MRRVALLVFLMVVFGATVGPSRHHRSRCSFIDQGFIFCDASAAATPTQTPAQVKAANLEATRIYLIWNQISPVKTDKVGCTALTLTKFNCELRAPGLPGPRKCLLLTILASGRQTAHRWAPCQGKFALPPAA